MKMAVTKDQKIETLELVNTVLLLCLVVIMFVYIIGKFLK